MYTKKLRMILLVLCAMLSLLPACSGNGGEADDIPTETAEGGVSATVPVEALQEGDPYRDFTATLTTGETFTLSDYEGKIILLNFWATWCGPCVREMPAFPRLQETFGDDLVLVAVNCGEDEETVTAFLEENGYEFKVILDPEYAVSDLYPSDGIPYTLIIGPDGTVAHITVGAADADTMFDMYSAQIAELPDLL